jgi:mannose-6-phosphate isomerase-like protein (cupin superfamily)
MKTLIVQKPWGKFEQFTHNEKTTVKILTINKKGILSLQYHAKRSEFWKVISGHPIITIGKKVISAKPGDEFNIAKRKTHRIEAKDGAVQVLEIAHGDFKETGDIVRLEDIYGRVNNYGHAQKK